MKKNIEVEAYIDPEGDPTCCSNYRKGETCVFFRLQKLGTVETCAFSNMHITIENGYLRPNEQCPLWGKK